MSAHFRTVPTLAEVPGAYERGVSEFLRLLSVRHHRRFVLVEDEPETTGRGTTPVSEPDDSTERGHAA